MYQSLKPKTTIHGQPGSLYHATTSLMFFGWKFLVYYFICKFSQKDFFSSLKLLILSFKSISGYKMCYTVYCFGNPSPVVVYYSIMRHTMPT